jgi:hypothetical protein
LLLTPRLVRPTLLCSLLVGNQVSTDEMRCVCRPAFNFRTGPGLGLRCRAREKTCINNSANNTTETICGKLQVFYAAYVTLRATVDICIVSTRFPPDFLRYCVHTQVCGSRGLCGCRIVLNGRRCRSCSVEDGKVVPDCSNIDPDTINPFRENVLESPFLAPYEDMLVGVGS